MANSTSTQLISTLLHAPQSATESDIAAISAIKHAYPYFVPTRYIEAAAAHKKEPFTPAMLASMQLYSGNWILFCDYLQPSATQPTPVDEIEAPIESIVASEQTTPSDKNENVADTEERLLEETSIDIEEDLIAPVYSEDYFRHQGVEVSNTIPEKIPEDEEDKSLMVMMSFADWLLHFKHKNEAESEEEKEKKALKTMWQKEKLAAAAEEENEEIPENVFEMAVNSITNEDDLASESLADIYIKQKKYDKAVEMYHKLSLRNPQKNAYFARKIEEVLKEKQS